MVIRFCFGQVSCFLFSVHLSPLNFLAEHFYFSAHMVSHIIILLLAAPFMVAARTRARSVITKFLFEQVFGVDIQEAMDSVDHWHIDHVGLAHPIGFQFCPPAK